MWTVPLNTFFILAAMLWGRMTLQLQETGNCNSGLQYEHSLHEWEVGDTKWCWFSPILVEIAQ